MLALDIIILVPILFGAYMGFRKGLIIEVATLVAFALGIYAGIKFSNKISFWFTEVGSSAPKYVPVFAFACCFLAVVILVFFLGKWLERFVKLALLKPIDKILGGFFALVKMLIMAGVLFIIIDAYNQRNPIISDEQKSNSLLYKPLSDLALMTLPFVDNSGLILTAIELEKMKEREFEEGED